MAFQLEQLLGVVRGSLRDGAVAIAAAALVAAAPSALARSPDSDAEVAMAEVQATCGRWAELAGRVMDLRQQGMPEEQAMDHTLGNAFLEALVVGAYDVRQLALPGLRAEETRQFKNRWYLNCLRGTASENQH